MEVYKFNFFLFFYKKDSISVFSSFKDYFYPNRRFNNNTDNIITLVW